jgi:hypothetical protein
MPSRDNRIENDRQSRRAARDAQQSVELYKPPSEDECFKDENEIYLSKHHQILTVLWFHEGRLVRFFIAWMSRDRDGEWSERYSVCAQHGYFHEHTTGHHRPDDRQDILPLRSQVDVQECHDSGYERVHNRYIFATGGG